MGGVGSIAGGLLSGLVGGHGPLASAMAEIGVSVDMVTKITDALSHNDIKLFERLCNDVLSENSLSVETKLKLQDLLHAYLGDMLNNNTIQLFSGNTGLGMSTLAALFAIIVLLILKDASYSLQFFLWIVFFSLLTLFFILKQAVDEFPNVMARLGSTSSGSLMALPAGPPSSRSKFASTLVEKAECGVVVSKEVETKVKHIEHIMGMSCVAELCQDLTAALDGKLRGYKEDEPFGLYGLPVREMKQEMKKMEQSAESVTNVVDAMVDANATLAEVADVMDDEIVALRKSVEFSKDNELYTRYDFMLTAGEKEDKDRITKKIQDHLQKVCGICKTQLKKVRPSEDDFDYRAIKKQNQGMIKALAYNPIMAEAGNKAFQEAIVARDALNNELADKMLEKAEAEAKVQDVKAQIDIAQEGFETMLREQNIRISGQKQLLKGLGQGTITMRGSPPSNDEVAKKYYRLWQEGNWDEITSMGSYYSRSGGRSFSVAVDSSLTPAQQEGMRLMSQYVQETDRFKKDHQTKMAAMDQQLQKLTCVMPLKEKAVEEAQKKVDENCIKDQDTWKMFATKHPLEFADIDMIFTVNKYIGKMASWMFQDNHKLAQIKTWVGKLEDFSELQEGFDPKVLLPVMKNIEDLLMSPNASPIAFLKAVGSHPLKKAMRPTIKGGFEQAKCILEDIDAGDARDSAAGAIELD